MAELRHLSIEEFLARLASREPTPGGGAVGALTGALAAALGEMTCAYTLNHPKFAAAQDEVAEIATRLERARGMLVGLIDEDARAYAGLSGAFKTPKTDVERQDRIAAAASVAAGVPFQTAELAARLQSDLQRLLEVGNPMLRSDTLSALAHADAAVAAAAANVRANLPYLPEAERVRFESGLARLNAGGCGTAP